MNTTAYTQLYDDLADIAQEVLNDQEPACNFSDDSGTMVEFEADFMSVFEDR